MAQVVTRPAQELTPTQPTTPVAPLDVETTTASRSGFGQTLQRALSKFLAVPLGILVAFLIAGILVYALDKANPGWVQPLRNWIKQYIFPQPQTTGSFLGTVAGGLLTQTSIVISMLLIVLQNTATNMGNLVSDQFVRRRRNQVYVGYVVGSVMLALFLRSTVSDSFNPVLGGVLVLVVMFFAMALLAWFLYTVMNQMKPEVIVSAIHSTAMEAWKANLRTLARTRRRSISPADVLVLLRSTTRGYVTHIDLDKIDTCLTNRSPETEVVIDAIIGDFVSYRDIIAQIRGHDLAEARAVAQCVGEAYELAREREPLDDARFNLEQFEMVAWTTGSTSKQNPETPLMVLHALRDLLRRWTLQDLTPEDVKEPVAVVYPDRIVDRAFDALESIAVASTESKQHQVLAEVLRSLAIVYRDLPQELRRRADTLLCRIVAGFDQHLYTVELEVTLDAMVFTLRDVGNDEMADMLAQAQAQLAKTAGQVSSGGSKSGGSKSGGSKSGGSSSGGGKGGSGGGGSSGGGEKSGSGAGGRGGSSGKSG